MAETIGRKEWSERIGKEVENLDLRLAELRMIGADNGKEDEYFFTKNLILKARQMLHIAEFSIFGFQIIDEATSVYEEGENNEQQETSNTSETESK